MDPKLITYLKKHNIKYTLHKHLPVFTVAQNTSLKHNISDALHTKNLFLKGTKSHFFLVSMYANKKLNLKKLKESINAVKKLSFATHLELEEHLKVKPGSVSIFSMIHAKSVELILDNQVWSAKKVGFHPNINTETLEISHENLEKYYYSLESKKSILEL
jgi:Ala-tRNA(Pro) deacylase